MDRLAMIAALRSWAWSATKGIVTFIVGAAVGAVISHYVTLWLSRGAAEEAAAHAAASSMLTRCPVNDYREFIVRRDAFLDAIRQAKAQGRGTPVWRDDCTIGVEDLPFFNDWESIKDELLRKGQRR